MQTTASQFGVIDPPDVSGDDDLVSRLELAEAQNRQLRASLLRIVRADRRATATQLTAMILHAIRNPLTGITVQTELLQMEQIDDRLQGDIDSIGSIAWALSDLTDAIQQRCTEPAKAGQAVDVRTTVHHVMELIGPLAPDGVEVDALPALYDLPVRCQAATLTQMLMNLVLNSLDALTNSEGRVEIRTGLCGPGDDLPIGDDWTTAYAQSIEADLADDCFVFIEISDNGTGIEPQRLQHILESPFSMDNVSSGNLGLGLALCRYILRGLGGNLRLSSQVGVGTQARLLLPLCDAASEPEEGRS